MNPHVCLMKHAMCFGFNTLALQGVDLLKMSLPLRGRAIIHGINPSARALTGLISLETKRIH